MIDISKHITMQEATHSDTAVAHGISNLPEVHHIKSMQYLAQTVFEPLRANFDNPIQVTSFFRNPALNKIVKGSPTSQHLIGEAMDIKGINTRSSILYYWIKDNLPFDQLIWEFGDDSEPDWIHVSFTKAKNRYQALRSVKLPEKTKYLPMQL